MATINISTNIKKLLFFILCIVMSTSTAFGLAIFQEETNQNQDEYVEYSGVVADSESGNALVFATLAVNETNISTITNSDGNFLLKVPKDMDNAKVTISYLGYDTKEIPVSELKKEDNKILLKNSMIELSEINLVLPSDAKALVRSTLKKKAENNVNQHVLMTAFYRETIKKGRKNASLAEAIVNVYKQPYTSSKNDNIELFKARKSTDYNRLDTIALKLQGGPYNPLYIDLMKYPEYIFNSEMIDKYRFSFAPSTTINGKSVYVVQFKQLNTVAEPLYYGKLYIDSETLALKSAIYNLNVENKELTSNLFVRKKPNDITVYPTNAAYRVDYREKDGKWYYGYGNVQLSFKVKRKRKWFSSNYSLTSEMAVTDWEFNIDNEKLKNRERLKKSVVISDAASGFSDPEFWGAYNVIEPEKSIESAIDKIKKQLKRANKGG
ncbi:carboxypeptidase-like regulatory domain-containing protein [Aureibaculum sp. 2210JD6-5]|uniref:carboxypeptidase-like regulatory domain-containing protein n=1 Tax=Aureibaculum sp. 2210JD6-5 TaxID=3103957 RepID=UPI002AAE2E03|nr:carboxypeptidase-like regulatory domain-containing protein [Aureibaculum sp. 2210JD6-5]MDY7395023.1 carboxypeptidase-like regulatory domain-containing protein [Aureibaculum sp. 2210JD6-5]